MSQMEERLKDAQHEIDTLITENRMLSHRVEEAQTKQHHEERMQEKRAAPKPTRRKPRVRPASAVDPTGYPLQTKTDDEQHVLDGAAGWLSPPSLLDDPPLNDPAAPEAALVQSSKWKLVRSTMKATRDLTRHTHTQGGYRISPSPEQATNQPRKKKYVRIGGKVLDPTKVQAAIEQAHRNAHASAGKRRKSPASSMIEVESGSFARIAGVAANAALAFDDAEDVSMTKNRMSKNSFLVPTDAPKTDDSWNHCHSKLSLVHVHG